MAAKSDSLWAPLVIVGPTASGKSDLGMALALRCREQGTEAEIISVDAKAVYRTMDIGTAKVSAEERATVPHHLIDVADPSQEYTVSEFADQGRQTLEELEGRGVQPILVGGTGLYVRALVDGFTIPGRFPEVVAELENEPDTEALHRRLAELDPYAATKMEPNNRRRVLRALEVTIGSGEPFSSFGPGVDRYPPTRFVQAGLEIDRAVLDERIDRRYDLQMADGLLEEAKALADSGLSRTAREALGYRELFRHLAGDMTLEEALTEARQRTKRFARRQQRWFRRDTRIVWFDAMASDLADQVEIWWGEQSQRFDNGALDRADQT